jgi:hypothetical protein
MLIIFYKNIHYKVTLNYFNPETKTLTVPYDFNEKLENLPEGITKIIFEGDYYFDCSIFNQPISQNTLPANLTHLTYYSTSKLIIYQCLLIL